MSFFDEERVDEIREAFNLKAGEDGKVPCRACGDILRAMGFDPSVKDTIALEGTCDDGSGNLQFEPFLEAIKERCDVPFDEDKLEKAFRVMQQGGKVQSAELKHFMSAFAGDDVTSDELDKFMEIVPTSGASVDTEGLIKKLTT